MKRYLLGAVAALTAMAVMVGCSSETDESLLVGDATHHRIQGNWENQLTKTSKVWVQLAMTQSVILTEGIRGTVGHGTNFSSGAGNGPEGQIGWDIDRPDHPRRTTFKEWYDNTGWNTREGWSRLGMNDFFNVYEDKLEADDEDEMNDQWKNFFGVLFNTNNVLMSIDHIAEVFDSRLMFKDRNTGRDVAEIKFFFVQHKDGMLPNQTGFLDDIMIIYDIVEFDISASEQVPPIGMYFRAGQFPREDDLYEMRVRPLPYAHVEGTIEGVELWFPNRAFPIGSLTKNHISVTYDTIARTTGDGGIIAIEDVVFVTPYVWEVKFVTPRTPESLENISVRIVPAAGNRFGTWGTYRIPANARPVIVNTEAISWTVGTGVDAVTRTISAGRSTIPVTVGYPVRPTPVITTPAWNTVNLENRVFWEVREIATGRSQHVSRIETFTEGSSDRQYLIHGNFSGQVEVVLKGITSNHLFSGKSIPTAIDGSITNTSDLRIVSFNPDLADLHTGITPNTLIRATLNREIKQEDIDDKVLENIKGEFRRAGLPAALPGVRLTIGLMSGGNIGSDALSIRIVNANVIDRPGVVNIWIGEADDEDDKITIGGFWYNVSRNFTLPTNLTATTNAQATRLSFTIQIHAVNGFENEDFGNDPENWPFELELREYTPGTLGRFASVPTEHPVTGDPILIERGDILVRTGASNGSRNSGHYSFEYEVDTATGIGTFLVRLHNGDGETFMETWNYEENLLIAVGLIEEDDSEGTTVGNGVGGGTTTPGPVAITLVGAGAANQANINISGAGIPGLTGANFQLAIQNGANGAIINTVTAAIENVRQNNYRISYTVIGNPNPGATIVLTGIQGLPAGTTVTGLPLTLYTYPLPEVFVYADRAATALPATGVAAGAVNLFTALNADDPSYMFIPSTAWTVTSPTGVTTIALNYAAVGNATGARPESTAAGRRYVSYGLTFPANTFLREPGEWTVTANLGSGEATGTFLVAPSALSVQNVVLSTEAPWTMTVTLNRGAILPTDNTPDVRFIRAMFGETANAINTQLGVDTPLIDGEDTYVIALPDTFNPRNWGFYRGVLLAAGSGPGDGDTKRVDLAIQSTEFVSIGGADDTVLTVNVSLNRVIFVGTDDDDENPEEGDFGGFANSGPINTLVGATASVYRNTNAAAANAVTNLEVATAGGHRIQIRPLTVAANVFDDASTVTAGVGNSTITVAVTPNGGGTAGKDFTVTFTLGGTDALGWQDTAAAATLRNAFMLELGIPGTTMPGGNGGQVTIPQTP